ncbi:hypothetical protein V1477_008641 [Vespula maculifrons]|uniref:Uncharacterized protein n=1 Tax=Vespula maculifrons TaxID=7453 RepID=A0ABD2CDL2_VESMC
MTIKFEVLISVTRQYSYCLIKFVLHFQKEIRNMRSERDENILKPIYSANVKAKFYFQNSDNTYHQIVIIYRHIIHCQNDTRYLRRIRIFRLDEDFYIFVLCCTIRVIVSFTILANRFVAVAGTFFPDVVVDLIIGLLDLKDFIISVLFKTSLGIEYFLSILSIIFGLFLGEFLLKSVSRSIVSFRSIIIFEFQDLFFSPIGILFAERSDSFALTLSIIESFDNAVIFESQDLFFSFIGILFIERSDSFALILSIIESFDNVVMESEFSDKRSSFVLL